MREGRDIDGHLLPDELRITRMGRIIRAWSLDELPELFNVLKGEMSFVGPRPLMKPISRAIYAGAGQTA